MQKIENSPRSVGVFGYSYLEENLDKVQGLPMNGVEPTYENISSFAYPGARPLYVYVKAAHRSAIPGLDQYLQEWVSSWGPGGTLADIGLVPSPDAEREKNATAATEYVTISADDLK